MCQNLRIIGSSILNYRRVDIFLRCMVLEEYLNVYVLCRYCTSHMQHLGLLPVSAKASSKATKNGQHNHHCAEHSARMLSKLGNPSDLLSCSVVTSAELSKAASDPHLFHEAGMKSGLTVALDKRFSSATKSIPIAQLYPELAEKLDLESKVIRSDGHKAVNLPVNNSRSQPLNHRSAVNVDKRLKDGMRLSSDVSRTATSCLPSQASNRFPLVVTSSSRPSVELQTSNMPNLTRLMLDPVTNSSAVVSSSLVGYPWQTSVSGGSAASVVRTSPQLLQGLLNATSLPCLKFPTPSSVVSVPSIRPSQNTTLLHSQCESTLSETGKTSVKPGLPVLRPQTFALGRSDVEVAGHLKSQPCAACMVRPRTKANWQHRDLRLRRKSLHESAWKLYSDHVTKVDSNTDILPCGM